MNNLVTQLLLALVRILFGFFIGGFLGVLLGVLIGVVSWFEKGGNQLPLEDLITFTILGASLGAILGLTNLLSHQDSEKVAKQQGLVSRKNWNNHDKDSEEGNNHQKD